MRSEEIKNKMNQNSEHDIFGKIMALEIDIFQIDGNKHEHLHMIIKESNFLTTMLKICLLNNDLFSYFSDNMYILSVNRIVKEYQRVIKELEEESKKSLLSK